MISTHFFPLGALGMRRGGFIAIRYGLAVKASPPLENVSDGLLGNAERVIILANNACAHETLRNRILLPKISRAEQRHQRTSSSFRPSLPPYPLTPRRPSAS